MKFNTAFVLLCALLNVTLAASITKRTTMPTCGLLCIETALTTTNSCSATNTTCMCTNAVFLASTTACVSTSCSVPDALTIAKINEVGCGETVESDQEMLRILVWVFCLLAIGCVIVRMFVKLHLVNQLGMDDYLILVSGVLTVPYIYVSLTLTNAGFGLDMWDVDQSTLDKAFMFFLIDEVIYLINLALTKLSLIFFLMKIFPSRNFRKACWVLIVFTAAVGVTFVMVSIFSCHPISYFWTRWNGSLDGTCNDINTQTYAAAGINIVQDFSVLALPIPELFKLQVSLRKKVQLFAMFSVGLFVSLISIIRLKALVEFGNPTNPTKQYVSAIVWSVIETQMAIVCACMPSIRHLLGQLFPKAFMSTKKSTSAATDPRIWATRSFKIENKLRSNNDFHELDDANQFGGSFVSSDHKNDSTADISKDSSSRSPIIDSDDDEEVVANGSSKKARGGSVYVTHGQRTDADIR